MLRSRLEPKVGQLVDVHNIDESNVVQMVEEKEEHCKNLDLANKKKGQGLPILKKRLAPLKAKASGQKKIGRASFPSSQQQQHLVSIIPFTFMRMEQ